MLDPKDYNQWARQILWATTLPESCDARNLNPESQACADWVKAFQAKHGLLDDGKLGPTTLMACLAEDKGEGMGALIIDGREVSGSPMTARCFTRQSDFGESQRPDYIVLMSGTDLHRSAVQRFINPRKIRTHFTIDASRGKDGHSLVIQWADPLRPVHFQPVERAGDYLPHRFAIGIELENPLAVHYRERESRLRERSRTLVQGNIGPHSIRQLSYFPEQMATLRWLLEVLERELGIPMKFPITTDGQADLQCDPEQWMNWKGVLGRFHISAQRQEPGVGFLEYLDQIFPDLHHNEHQAAKRKAEADAQKIPPRLRRIRPVGPSIEDIDEVRMRTGREVLEETWKSPPPSKVIPKSVRATFSLHQILNQSPEDREKAKAKMQRRARLRAVIKGEE